MKKNSPLSPNAREYRVRDDIKKHLRTVLGRQWINCWFRKRRDQLYCRVCLSGNDFHRALKRALCEKLSDETGILYITLEESRDPAVAEALMHTFKKSSFCIYTGESSREEEKDVYDPYI